MKNIKYNDIADLHKAPKDRLKNSFVAFICGGVMGFFAELIIESLSNWFSLNRNDSAIYMITFFIFISCLFTSLGFFDKLVTKFKCGLIIPITGFAHSVMSSTLDSKREGPIYGLGSNMFKLSGSVILYGVVSAFVFGLIRYLIGVI